MRTVFFYLLALFLPSSFLQAGDYIIVVDASQSMRRTVPVVKPGKKTASNIAKMRIVADQITQYLKQIPEDGSRVYLMFFADGIITPKAGKFKGKILAKQFKFVAGSEGKKEALEQAAEYCQTKNAIFTSTHSSTIVVGGTHLWSSFAKALEHAEEQEYYRAAKPGSPGRMPYIFLLSDGADDQKSKPKWVYRAPANDPNMERAILNKFPWLRDQETPVWFQLDTRIRVQWEGEVYTVDGDAPEFPLNPPNLSLKDKDGKFVKTIKVGDAVTADPKGDPRYIDWQLFYKENGGDWVPVDGKLIRFTKSGRGQIKLVGVTAEKPRPDRAFILDVEVQGMKPPAALVINPDFEVLYNNKEPVKDGDTIWTGKTELGFTLYDKTKAMQMKKQLSQKELADKLQFKWYVNVNGKLDANPVVRQKPPPVSLKAGKYQIYLTVNEAGKPANLEKGTPLDFTIKQVEVKIGIKGTKAGQPFTIKQGMSVDFIVVEYDGPKGATYQWDFGDKTPKSRDKEPKHTYQEPTKPEKPYQVKVEVTLPSGEVMDPFLLADTVQVTALNAKATATPNDPWLGQTVKFETNATNVEKVTWFVDNKPMEPNKVNFSLDHVFTKPGKQDVYALIKQKGLVTELKAPADVIVKDVLPKIVMEKTDLYIGEETGYKVVQAGNDKSFPTGFGVKLVLPKDGKTKGQKIFFTKPGKQEVYAEVTPPGSKAFKSAKAEIINVKLIAVEIDFAPKAPKK